MDLAVITTSEAHEDDINSIQWLKLPFERALAGNGALSLVFCDWFVTGRNWLAGDFGSRTGQFSIGICAFCYGLW